MPELPLGAYDRLVTRTIEEQLRGLDPDLVSRLPIDPAEAHQILARHIGSLTERALRFLGTDDAAAVKRQVELVNRLIAYLVQLGVEAEDTADLVTETHDVLQAIVKRDPPKPIQFPRRPETPLGASALLVNGRDQPRIGTEIQRELASADDVDLLCAFVRWYGVRVLDDYLAEFARRGGRLRVITTTYMGATERRAIDRLAEIGAQVRISYETRMTRLHAKAWLFRRASGFSTAYVGSSNLSRSALLDGLEWNVRLSESQQGHLLDTFRATFDEYWDDPTFEAYDPHKADDVARLDAALATARGGAVELPLQVSTLEVRPYGFQQEVLDELAAEREVHNRWRNLVVMATGTGKTVVAGLDYRRLRATGKVDRLLFVAHREEILAQSLATFRQIVRDGSFGELLVGGERPQEWRHVFASVQSLARLELAKDLPADSFDMVIVDEFHHAAETTKTYAALLNHLRPKVLLGLTATPERADGEDVRVWFDGRYASELRLWEALERGLLVPFQYFGIHDNTDLKGIQWKRGVGYAPTELTKLYTGHDARLQIVLESLKNKITDIRRMRAFGFCVSIEHAEFMARRFSDAGIPSLAVTSATPQDARTSALRALRTREVNVLFTVDLFNEGIDVPEVDTVLFLRPTESPTIFLQQLGRGLRLAEDKPCLTVLDFIGGQNAEFRFDLRYSALTGVSRRDLVYAIAEGFPTLPAGCHIELDRVASDLVMENVRTALKINWNGLASELRRIGDVTLNVFLEQSGVELDDIYRNRRGGWAQLRRQAGFDQRDPGPDDDRLAAAFGRLLHVDDLERLSFIDEILERAEPPTEPRHDLRQFRSMAMLHFALWGSDEALDQMRSDFGRLWSNPARHEELAQLAVALRSRVRRVTEALSHGGRVPLHLHARYSRDEALAAFGVDNPDAVRQGVRWVEAELADLFFVTLRKSEKHYSPTTMYQDRAISPNLFQWESQSTTSVASKTGQRYINHIARGSAIHFFMRESKEQDGYLGAPPYLYAGPATYVSHSGDRPLRMLWRLLKPLPADMFHSARVATG